MINLLKPVQNDAPVMETVFVSMHCIVYDGLHQSKPIHAEIFLVKLLLNTFSNRTKHFQCKFWKFVSHDENNNIDPQHASICKINFPRDQFIGNFIA